MSSAAVRPGVAGGVYPERDDAREGWLERLAHEVLGGGARRRHAAPARFEEFARSVDRAAAGLAASSGKLERLVPDVRRGLLQEGLSDPVLARVFALVREAARRTLGVTHYDVQLMGGWAMARGMLAEMETGEGKTLAATLPACAGALAGIPVHVISVNDYLVQRDAEAMGPVYAALGLSVGTVTARDRDPAARRAAYACDVAYVTSKELAFDYLRDGLERGRGRDGLSLRLDRLRGRQAQTDRLLLRGLCFAIIDEADSVLIDEARTPLILAGPGSSPDERDTCCEALRLARELARGRDFRLDRRSGRVDLIEEGRRRLEELARPLGGVWAGPRRREEWVVRALGALHLFERDRHYLVRNDAVEIIDQPTGRSVPDRAWERGLHQLVEVKEGCPVTPRRETLARISYQRLFRRYLRLAGMTGTAREVAAELRSVYRLDTVSIPSRLPSRRRVLPARVFASQAEKWAAVVARVRDLHGRGLPVLVGTCSVADSERLSRLLHEHELPHQVLNARQDGREAAVVAEAGRAGRITVATHMAGRGTDIRLGSGVAERGGLHVIATQSGEARRIDRQLFGRCGRQGDPGTCEAILSLEDEPLALYYPEGLVRGLRGFLRRGPLAGKPAERLTRLPQHADEKRHARMRRSLTELEDYLNELLAFSGSRE